MKGVDDSHTEDLVEEAFRGIERFLEEKKNSDLLSIKDPLTERRGTGINRLSERFGIHLMKVDLFRKMSEDLYDYFGKLSSVQFLKEVLAQPEKFDEIYEMFSDDSSRQEFDWFVKYRVAYALLGKVAYDLFTPQITKEKWKEYLKQVERVGRSAFRIEEIVIKTEIDLLTEAFLIEQYRLPGIVEPQKGDFVLDIGAGFGETSLWFSKYVSEVGKVFTFEPSGYNFKILEENIRRNEVKNIEPVKAGVGKEEGEAAILGAGGSAFVSDTNSSGYRIPIATIDNFVRRKDLQKVDFIKMDIEGMELEALLGAQETIKTYRPRLAICVYHKGDDLLTIPKYLRSLIPEYNLYLRHATPSWTDTVLFAK